MDKLLSRFIKKKKIIRISPEERARVAFETQAKEQFKRLKEKGLGITVFSL